jgi:hypothetical protein
LIETTTKASLTIRPLTIEELPLCLPYGPAFMKEYDLPGTFSNEEFLKNWTLWLTAYPAIMYGLWEGTHLAGGIGGMIHPDINTGDLLAVEFFWYVEPSRRKTLLAARLPLTFKKWGKRNGAIRWKMIHLLAQDEEPSTVKLASFYKDVCKMKANEVVFDGPI